MIRAAHGDQALAPVVLRARAAAAGGTQPRPGTLSQTLALALGGPLAAGPPALRTRRCAAAGAHGPRAVLREHAVQRGRAPARAQARLALQQREQRKCAACARTRYRQRSQQVTKE